MRLRIVAVAAVAVLAFYAVRHKAELPAPPDPTALILSMRNQVQPFRFSLGTEPEQPHCDAPLTLRVHVVDAAGQPVDGLKIEANVLMIGTDHGSQQLTLHSKGRGNYEGRVTLEMAGSWDVDLIGTKDGKRVRERLSIEVGPAQGSPRSRDDDDDDS